MDNIIKEISRCLYEALDDLKRSNQSASLFITEALEQLTLLKTPLAARNVVTCVYCGHEYSEGTPATKSRLLTGHIKVCEKHPMRAAEESIIQLRDALMGFIGIETTEELDAMELAVRSLPGPDEDKAVAINALHALKATAPDQKGPEGG